MRLFGLEITRRRPPAVTKAAEPVGSWWRVIYDAWPGGWQQASSAATYSNETLLAYHAVYACVTLISNDIGKLRMRLVAQDPDTGVWSEADSRQGYAALLRRPNTYQNQIQFKEWWITSKLLAGNAYALKQRDARGAVTALYLLDPTKVRPLVTPQAEVYYELQSDNMARLDMTDGMAVTVPASEIVHDRMNCLFHPLVGVTPIYACGDPANAGLQITKDQSKFFGNRAAPGGVLTAPGNISDGTAERLKAYWQENFTGDNAGAVAILGDGLHFEPMRMTATDAQLIEQLRWTAEAVCSAFHVPAFKIGIGAMPTYQNAEVLNQIYYSDCLQSLIEQFEACMDDALDFGTLTGGRQLGVELDLRGLLRMDSATQIKTLADAVGGGILAPNEARRELDRPPLKGGDTVYLQQQYYSLEALAERDENAPFAKPAAPAPADPPADSPSDSPSDSADPEDSPEDDLQMAARLEELLARDLGPESMAREFASMRAAA